jgi:hypothetical protein
MRKSPQRNQLLINIKNYIKKHRGKFYVLISVFIGIIVGFSVYFITNSKKNEKFNYLDRFKHNPSKPSNSAKLFRIYGLNGKYIDLTNDVLHGNSDGQQKGCWTLDSTPEWKAALKDNYKCAAISISLPDDIKATSYTSYHSWDGLCNQMKIEDIPAGVQNYALKTLSDGTPACGFMFQKNSATASGSSKHLYSDIKNPNTETKLGCPYTLGLTTSDANEEAVRKTCDVDPECVGYYKGSAGWNLATRTLPNECSDFSKNPSGYNIFKSKSSNYSNTPNPIAETKAGCIYSPGLTTSDANEEYVKNTCDLDPKCVGYYKGSTGWSVATQTLPKNCKNFSGDAGYKDFMMKINK